MLRRVILGFPLVMSACLPLDVALVQQSSNAIIDGANVSYNEDYLVVSRQLQPLANTPQDKAAARQAISAYCGNQGLGFLDRTSSYFVGDATWRFRGNCVYPDGTPL